MSKPHIKRLLRYRSHSEPIWGWGVWFSKESCQNGDRCQWWSPTLDGLESVVNN